MIYRVSLDLIRKLMLRNCLHLANLVTYREYKQKSCVHVRLNQ